MPTTTTKGIRIPVAADDNDNTGDVARLATDVDSLLTGVYTSAEIAAFTAGQKWQGRRVYNSTVGLTLWWDATAAVWKPEIGSLILRTGRVTSSTQLPVVSVGSSRVDLQACKLEYSIVSPK